jgi:hypothetical protein
MLEEWVEVYFKSLARYFIVGVRENHVTSLFSSCPYSNRILAGVRAYPLGSVHSINVRSETVIRTNAFRAYYFVVSSKVINGSPCQNT